MVTCSQMTWCTEVWKTKYPSHEQEADTSIKTYGTLVFEKRYHDNTWWSFAAEVIRGRKINFVACRLATKHKFVPHALRELANYIMMVWVQEAACQRVSCGSVSDWCWNFNFLSVILHACSFNTFRPAQTFVCFSNLVCFTIMFLLRPGTYLGWAVIHRIGEMSVAQILYHWWSAALFRPLQYYSHTKHC